MAKKWLVAAVLSILAAACSRKRIAATATPTRPDSQLSRVATPIEVIPASADLEPGASRQFFARIITPEERLFRYDSNLFTWRMQEENGGTLTPGGKSQLYFAYTSPKKPGYYHLLVALKEKPNLQAVVSIKVGNPEKANAPEVAAERRRPNGAFLPE